MVFSFLLPNGICIQRTRRSILYICISCCSTYMFAYASSIRFAYKENIFFINAKLYFASLRLYTLLNTLFVCSILQFHAFA